MPVELTKEQSLELLKSHQSIDLDNLGLLQPVLEDIQGNILKSHGRDYTVCILLQFNSDVEAVKKWISEFAEKYVTSVMKQYSQRQRFEKFLIEKVANQFFDSANETNERAINKTNEREVYKETLKVFRLRNYQERSRSEDIKQPTNLIFTNFFLSFKGYEALNLAHEKQNEFQATNNLAFKIGMSSEQEIRDLEDDLNQWEKEYKEPIHALILLADNDSRNIGENAKKIRQDIEARGIAKVVKIETGFARRNDESQSIEPFGFPHNISQPLFLKEDIDRAKKEESFSDWNPSATLDLVIAIDPFGKQFKDPSKNEEYSFGSYCVYRKLQQNVDLFKKKEQQLVDQLKIPEDLVSAFIVGRFRDGRPVTIYGTTEEKNPIVNNFNYKSDWNSGTKCPFHAHIRKLNPRGTDNVESDPGYLIKPEEQLNSRIVRRGIPYGFPREQQSLQQTQNWQDYKQLLEELQVKLEDEGTLFLCFQSNITNQFRTIQGWANSKYFGPKSIVEENIIIGVDPVVGQGKDKQKPQHWPKEWGKEQNEQFNFSDCVTAKGGEYFFAPSLSFLKSLKDRTSMRTNGSNAIL